MEALEALERASRGKSAEIAQPVDISMTEFSNFGLEDVSNSNKDTSLAAVPQLDCSADRNLDISVDNSAPENSSAVDSSRSSREMKWRERARNRRPRPPVSAAENCVRNGSAVTITCRRRPLEFVRSSETGEVHHELSTISSPNVPHSVQEQEVGQSLQPLAAGPEISRHPLQEELLPCAPEADNRLSSQIRLAQDPSSPVEPMDVELSRGPFCPSPDNHIQASDFGVLDNEPWRVPADQSLSVPMGRPPRPPQQKPKPKQQRRFSSVTHSRGLKRIRPDGLTSSPPRAAGPPPKTMSNKRQKAPVRRPRRHATATQKNHVEPADDFAEPPLDVLPPFSGPDVEACESSYQDSFLHDPGSISGPELLCPTVPTHRRQKAPVRRPSVPAQASPVDPDTRCLDTLPLSVPPEGMPQANRPADSDGFGPSNQALCDSLSPSPAELVRPNTPELPDGLLQRPSGEEVTTQQERRAEYKLNIRRLRSQVSSKLKAWGRKSQLLQGEDETGAHHGKGEERLLMSEAQRDALVSQLVKSCRCDHWLRATFLDAVKELADAGVLQTSASQPVAQGPSDTSEEEVNAWKETSACSPPDCSSSPQPLLNLYKAVDLLHKKGESAMQNVVSSREDDNDPSLCSLHQTSDGAWALRMPVCQKRDKVSKPGL